MTAARGGGRTLRYEGNTLFDEALSDQMPSADTAGWLSTDAEPETEPPPLDDDQ